MNMTVRARKPVSTSWRPHPTAALILTIAIFVLPLVTAAVAARQVGIVVERDGAEIGRWVLVIATAVATMLVADRIARRLPPLAYFGRLYLDFPSRAPSRLALRRSVIPVFARLEPCTRVV